MIRPPITRIVSPVTYDDASDARNTHASAQFGDALPDHRLHRRRIADVTQHGSRAHAGLAALGGDGLELVAVDPRVQHEVGAFGREGERDRAPDVAAGAGDKRGLALQTHSAIVHAIPR
jgi:hypothetical protein